MYGRDHKRNCQFILLHLSDRDVGPVLASSKISTRYGFYKMLAALYRNVKYAFAEEIVLPRIRWLYSPAASRLFHLIVMKLDRLRLRSDCPGL